MNIKCPVCGKYKYWNHKFKDGEKYIQCKNCLSIINSTVLLARLKRA